MNRYQSGTIQLLKYNRKAGFLIGCFCLLLAGVSPAFSQVNSIKSIKTFELYFSSQPTSAPFSIIPHKQLAAPKIGLALSGGGLRGVSQIGVLKALEEANIPIDCIVGTSIGAVVGGLYASGYSPDDIWKITKSFDWSSVLHDTPERSSLFLGEKQKRGRAIVQFRMENFRPILPEALIQGQNLGEFLTRIVLNAPYHSQEFKNLKIPLRIIATDILTGYKKIIDHGDLAERMRSSIAIPLLFNPVEDDEHLLVDGGVLDNIPVEETRNYGADLVIAVNTTSPLRTREQLQSPWEIADQVTTIMQQQKNKEQLAQADVVISFEDLRGSSTDQDMIDSLYHAGRERATALLEKIRLLYNDKKNKTGNGLFFVNKIEVDTTIHTGLGSIINTRGTRRITGNEIYATLEKIYQTGDFENATARIVQANDTLSLQYQLTLNPRLDHVLFIGQTIFPDSVLQENFQELLGKPINSGQSAQALRKTLQLFRKKGYSLAEIQKIDYSPHLHRAVIYITEGKINSISFSGNKKTRNFVLANELNLHPGKVFRSDLAQKGINNIYGTGLFNSATLNLARKEEGVALNIHLQEKSSTVVRYGIRYDNERWGRSFLEFADENVLGMGNDLTLHGQYGSRDRILSAAYRADRIFNTYLTAQVDLHQNQNKYYAWDKSSQVGEYNRQATGVIFSIGQHIERVGTISAIMRLEEIDIIKLAGTGFDDGALRINTIGINSIVDTRNQVPFPANGKYHRFEYEVSTGNFLGNDISFFKVQNYLSTYFTILKRLTFSPRLFWGTSDLTTPFSEQFKLGGEESFYGLQEAQLQGRHVFLSSMQVRSFISKLWLFDAFLAFRYDFGAVWKSELVIEPRDFINGKGLAILLKTPLGPFSVAYGQSSAHDERIYFSAGYSF